MLSNNAVTVKTLTQTDREMGGGLEDRVALRKRDPWRLTKHKTSPVYKVK